jgi:hypothetical protein
VHTGSERKRTLALTAAVGAALVWAGLAATAPGDPKKQLNAADQAYAKTVVLRKAELPAGKWQVKPTDFSQANPACLVKHYSFAALTVSGETGLTFAAPAGFPLVESDALVFPTAAQAQRAFTIETKPGLARCVGAYLADELSKAAGTTSEVQRIEPLSFAGLPASAKGFKIVLHLRSSQGSGSLEVSFISIGRGRTLGELSLISVGAAPWPRGFTRLLTQRMASRMTKG